MSNYERETVSGSADACCANTLSLDHFCGNGSLLKKNKRSRCNQCGEEVPAEAWRSNDDPPRVYMRKYCPECGVTSSRVASDARFYYVSENDRACACGPGVCGTNGPLGENAKTASQLHTCTLVVEIVRGCNLTCPTCYADSPKASSDAELGALPFDVLVEQVRRVLDRQDKIDILQLSGGEPTLHPELFRIIEWLAREGRVSDVLLNTNGVRLTDPSFMERLQAVIPRGRFSVYLQFDGKQESGQVTMRGGDFRAVRERAMHACRVAGIPVALVMTVSHENKFDCGDTLDYALSDDNVRWVVYQPEFLSGRNDPRKRLEVPINVADIVHSVASGGVLDPESWMPLPCSDPNCGMVGFLVRVGGVWQPVSSIFDVNELTPLIVNRMNFDTDDSLSSCGCDTFSLGEYLERLGLSRRDVKMVFVKPFMDVRTWDVERIEACCTHVLTPSGAIDSFCRYYGTR